MADINLLQNNQNQNSKGGTAGVLNKLGIGLLILVVAVYVAYFILTQGVVKQTAGYQEQTTSIQNQITADKQYPELVRYQDKIHNIQLVLDHHLNWSTIIDRFAAATLRTATLSSFVANSDGSAVVSGFVTNFSDLDKQIKAYQLKDFEYIKDVELINVSLSDKEKIGIDFVLKVTFNTNLLKNNLAQQ